VAALARTVLATFVALSLATLADVRTGAAPEPEADGAARPRAELARGRMLVASDGLLDPNFRETVVLLLEHDPALGVVINRPTVVKLADALPEVTELAERSDTVFLGGPVARDRMVILVRTPTAPAESTPVLDDVFATARLDVLRELASSSSATDRFRAYAGFAGWAPQQLEAEVARGDWLVVAGDAGSVFDARPGEVWRTLKDRASGQWVRGPEPRVRGPLATAAWLAGGRGDA